MIVVDASVAAKWLLAEPGEEEAHALLNEGQRLVAPELARWDVAGAILRRQRKSEITAAGAREALTDWDDILATGRLNLVSPADIYQAAIELATTTNHPLFDCVYVATAQHFSCMLLTADQTLVRRLRPAYPLIELLGELSIDTEAMQPH